MWQRAEKVKATGLPLKKAILPIAVAEGAVIAAAVISAGSPAEDLPTRVMNMAVIVGSALYLRRKLLPEFPFVTTRGWAAVIVSAFVLSNLNGCVTELARAERAAADADELVLPTRPDFVAGRLPSDAPRAIPVVGPVS